MIDRDLYHQELATAVQTLRDLDFKTLLEQEGIYLRLARTTLLEQILDNVSFEPDEQPSVISRLWDGIPSEPPIELSDDWLDGAPPEYKELVKQRWSELRLQKHLDLTYSSYIDAYFLERLADLEQIVYGMIRMRNQGAAEELYLRLIDDEADFAELAKTYSLGDERYTHGLVGPMSISQPHPSIRQALSQLAVGDIAPPLRIEQWVLLLRMEHRRPAQLNEATRQQLLNELFEKDLQAALETLLSPEEDTNQLILAPSEAIDATIEESSEDDPKANQALPETELTGEAESTPIADQPTVSTTSNQGLNTPESSIEEDDTQSVTEINNQSTETQSPDPVNRDSDSESSPGASTEQHGQQEPLESPVRSNLLSTSTDYGSSHHSLQSPERPELSIDIGAAQQEAHDELTELNSVRLEGEHASKSIDEIPEHLIDEATVNAEISTPEKSGPQSPSEEDQETTVPTEQSIDPNVLKSETLATSPEILVVSSANTDQPTPAVSVIPEIQPEIQETEPVIELDKSIALVPAELPTDFVDQESDGSDTNLTGHSPNELPVEASETNTQPSTPKDFPEVSSVAAPTDLSSDSGYTEASTINQTPAIPSNNSLDTENSPKSPELQITPNTAQPPSPTPVPNNRSNQVVYGLIGSEIQETHQVTTQSTQIHSIVDASIPSIDPPSSEILDSTIEDLESSHSHKPQTDEQCRPIETIHSDSDSDSASPACPQLNSQEATNLENNPVVLFADLSNDIDLNSSSPEDLEPSNRRESTNNSEQPQSISNSPIGPLNASGETQPVPETSQDDIQYDDMTGLPKANLPTTKEHDNFATSNVLLSD